MQFIADNYYHIIGILIIGIVIVKYLKKRVYRYRKELKEF